LPTFALGGDHRKPGRWIIGKIVKHCREGVSSGVSFKARTVREGFLEEVIYNRREIEARKLKGMNRRCTVNSVSQRKEEGERVWGQ
jgi:hypothetical protein